MQVTSGAIPALIISGFHALSEPIRMQVIALLREKKIPKGNQSKLIAG
jgi:DNA-binding transcriptional ArsR family regulator